MQKITDLEILDQQVPMEITYTLEGETKKLTHLDAIEEGRYVIGTTKEGVSTYYLKSSMQPLDAYLIGDTTLNKLSDLKTLKLNYDVDWGVLSLIGEMLTVNQPTIHTTPQSLDLAEFELQSKIQGYTCDFSSCTDLNMVILELLKLSAQYKNIESMTSFVYITRQVKTQEILSSNLTQLYAACISCLQKNKEDTYFCLYFNLLINLLTISIFGGDYLAIDFKSLLQSAQLNYNRVRRAYLQGDTDVFTLTTGNKVLPHLYIVPNIKEGQFRFSHQPCIYYDQFYKDTVQFALMVCKVYIMQLRLKKLNDILGYSHRCIALNTDSVVTVSQVEHSKAKHTITTPHVEALLKQKEVTLHTIEITFMEDYECKWLLDTGKIEGIENIPENLKLAFFNCIGEFIEKYLI